MFHYATPILAFVILSNPESGQPPDSASDSKVFPANLFLVRAKTVRVTPGAKGSRRGHFSVTHVYAGSGQLKGKQFECATGFPPFGSQIGADRDRFVQFLEEGADGLWWLYEDPKGNALRPELRASVVDRYRLRPFPYLNSTLGSVFDGRPHDGKAEYKEGLAWAEAVETVYRAKSDADREPLLRRLAATEGSPVAGWAIAVLGKAYGGAAARFLEPLADHDKLSADSRVTLDRVLCEISPATWRTSERRRRFLGTWLAAAPATSQLFAAGCERLLDGLRTGDVDFALYEHTIAPVLARADKLTEQEEWWVGRLLREPRFREGDRANAFDWTVRAVQRGKTAFLRAHAAAGLQNFRPLSPAEIETAGSLRQAVRDPSVQKELDVVLRAR